MSKMSNFFFTGDGIKYYQFPKRCQIVKKEKYGTSLCPQEGRKGWEEGEGGWCRARPTTIHGSWDLKQTFHESRPNNDFTFHPYSRP